MKEITGLTDNSKQSLIFVLENNTTFTLYLEFRSNINSWFYSITKDNFILNNKKLVMSPNILFQFTNILNFGISVLVNDGQDPSAIDDFINERVRLFVIENSEKQEIEDEFFK